MADNLKACPFCGGELRYVESWALSFSPNKLYHEYHHPENDCVLKKSRQSFQEDGDGKRREWIEDWNTRAADPRGDDAWKRAASDWEFAAHDWQLAAQMWRAKSDQRDEILKEAVDLIAEQLGRMADSKPRWRDRASSLRARAEAVGVK